MIVKHHWATRKWCYINYTLIIITSSWGHDQVHVGIFIMSTCFHMYVYHQIASISVVLLVMKTYLEIFLGYAWYWNFHIKFNQIFPELAECFCSCTAEKVTQCHLRLVKACNHEGKNMLPSVLISTLKNTEEFLLLSSRDFTVC